MIMKESLKKLNYIFNKKQKATLVLLILVIILGAVLELFGVSAILPVVYVIMDTNVIQTNEMLNTIYRLVGFENITTFMIFLISMIIVLYIIKNVFLGFRNYFKFSFTNKTQCEIADRMMHCYINQPYLFHSLNNTSVIQRNIVNDVGTFVAYILAMTDVVVGGVLCIFLVGFMLVTDTVITIVLVLLFMLLAVLFLRPYNKILGRYGTTARESGEKMVRWINQSLGGIKEVKIGETEEYFSGKFSKAFAKYANSEKMNQFLGGVPGLVMETACMAGVLLVVIVKLMQGEDANTLIPVLSVVAVAGMKLLTSFNTLTASVSRMYYTKPAMEALYKDLKELERLEKNEYFPQKSDDKLSFASDIQLNNICFSYPNSSRMVLDGISLKIKCGTSVALIGASGMGKTTLADLILGVIQPNAGDITVDGHSIGDHMSAWHKLFGYIPQNIYLMDDTIRNNIAFGIHKDDICEQDIWDAVEEAQLKDFIEGLEDGLDTVIGERGARISGGQRQRIGIARALYKKPSVLVLDEATSALDNETEKAVMEAIDGLHGKLTMIIIAHRLTTIKNCDNIYEIDHGTIIERSKEEINQMIIREE